MSDVDQLGNGEAVPDTAAAIDDAAENQNLDHPAETPEQEEERIFDALADGKSMEELTEAEGETEDARQDASAEADAGDDADAEDPAATEDDKETGAEPTDARAAWEQEKQALTHRLASAEGRVAAFQRRLEEFRKGADPAPAAPEPEKAADPTAADSALESIKEDYPEVYEPLAAHAKAQQEAQAAITEQLAAQGQELQNISAARTAETLAANRQTVLAAHPDLVEISSDPDFTAWLQKQPPRVQQIAIDNGTVIQDAQEASDLLRRFKQDRHYAQLTNPQPKDPAPSQDARRKRQREAAGAPALKQTSVAQNLPKTEEEWFDHYAAQNA